MSNRAWRYVLSCLWFGVFVYDHPNWNLPAAAHQVAMEALAMEACDADV